MVLQGDVHGLSARDVILPIVPMFHANAWGLASAPAVGAKLVMPGENLDPAVLAKTIELEEVTFTGAVPTVMQGLVDHYRATRTRPATLKRVIIGGARCPERIIEEFEDILGVEVVHGWGMTELSPLGTMNMPRRTPTWQSPEERNAFKVRQGRPPLGVDLRLVGDDGKPVPHDGKTSGHLCVKGWAAVARYYGEDNTALNADGYFDTGDVATIDRWRVPFLASALLIAVGMWIRLTVAESPIFQEALHAKSAAKMPVLDALKTYPKEIALAAGSFVATHATFYIVSVWLISYATTKLGYDRTTILNANTALSLSDIPMILGFGLLSDYIGRRKLFLTGMAVLGLFAIPYFMLVSTSNIWLFLLGGLIVQACLSAVYGPQSAYFAEQFSTRMRYSGSSLAYQFAAIVGGMAPLICTALIALTGSLYSVAAFVILIALVSLSCSYFMTETLRSGLRNDEPVPVDRGRSELPAPNRAGMT
jgi:AMP-binding enzyme/Major Facilitator Superfamily